MEIINIYLLHDLIKIYKEANKNKPISQIWLGRVIVALNKSVNGNFSFDTIRASGLYNWLYHKEQEGEFNPNQTVRSLAKYFEGYFGTKCAVDNLSKNYDIWKQIFYGY